jgi:hypothetical protein
VYETDPGLCPVAGFGINIYEPLVSVTIVLIFLFIAFMCDVIHQTTHYHFRKKAVFVVTTVRTSRSFLWIFTC